MSLMLHYNYQNVKHIADCMVLSVFYIHTHMELYTTKQNRTFRPIFVELLYNGYLGLHGGSVLYYSTKNLD